MSYTLQSNFLLNIQNQLKRILLSGGRIPDLLEFFSGIIAEDIVIIDYRSGKKYFSKKGKDFSDFIKNNSLEEAQNRYYSYEISYRNNIYAYLLINKKSKCISEKEKILISLIELPALMVLHDGREDILIEKENKKKFIQDLIFNRFNSLKKIENIVSKYNWDFLNMTPVLVIIISLLNASKKISYNIEKKCEEIILSEYPGSIYTIMGDKLIYIIRDVNEEKIFKQLLNSLVKRLEFLNEKSFAIGVGNKKSGIMLTHQSYNEALTALRIAKKISKKKIYYFNELGAYKILAFANSLQIEDFLKNYLNPLIEYDQENNQDLFDTLNTLVKYDWDIKEVSREQCIHYNTVKYRIKKIEDILDLNLNCSENKLNIAIALKLYYLYR